MNKTCDNCKYMARHSDLCCLKIADWKLRPESNTCDNWGAHPLVQLGIDIERTRCAKICEELADRLRSMADLSRAHRGDLNNSEADTFSAQSITAAACAKRIRGEK